MKTTKRFLSIMLIAMMTFCLSAFNVSAVKLEGDGPYSVTIKSDKIPDTANQTFTAYKVFDLTSNGGNYNYTIDTDKNDCLSTTDYGIYTPAYIDQDSTRAQAFGKVLYDDYISSNSNSNVFKKTSGAITSGTATISGLEKGYYVIVRDATTQDDDRSNAFVTLFTAPGDDDQINLKLDVPTLHKYIKHNDDNNNWGKYGDNQIGDTVYFKLETTVPDYVSYFENKYEYIIHDKLDAGLTFNSSSLKIYKHEDETDEIDASNYTIKTKVDNSTDDTDCTFEVAFNDFKSLGLTAGSTIYTYYEATLNPTAQISSGNSADKSNDNEAWLQYSNDPYANTTANSTHDKVYDWTFTANIKKVDSKNVDNGLAGAKFTVSDGTSNLKFIGNNGEYTVTNDSSGSEDIQVKDDGTLTIKGLDDTSKTYVLTETVAPDGYAKLTETISFSLTPAYQGTPNGSQIQRLVLGSTASETLAKVDDNVLLIKNTAGSKLVGTGGIGTTIFYIAGGVLMAGAVVLLVVKRRVNK